MPRIRQPSICRTFRVLVDDKDMAYSSRIEKPVKYPTKQPRNVYLAPLAPARSERFIL